ncbi:Glycosyltransferase involved in cell wall bisynthesis [Eubacterium maltosivorans]|uniref:glycosyltransferase n=1 Tax=Eubacterium maltosivorans TaxID=2041044 RepID=UPI00088E90AE|nr:glycosyltransferase [Eubacterium maltosivorans]WPK80836.1 hypothetical protein EUMA32_22480 [Eubacterium maltosivorans]SDP84697.1 Glycosyltransferase involved in cell wall bisynthesis [Eubacterium maltosivorans]
MKRKVLIVTGGYLPGKKYGGPVTSIHNLTSLLRDEFDFYIITRDHELGSKRRFDNISDGWNEVYGVKVFYCKDTEIKYKNLLNLICEIHPDLVYLNSFFDAQFLIPFLKISKKGLKILLAPRGELCENALNIKHFKKAIFIKVIKRFYLSKEINYHSTSKEETEQIARLLNVNKNRITQLNNIAYLEKKNLYLDTDKSKLKVFFYSRIVEKKNLKYALEVLQNINFELQFDIYGPIEDQNYWVECKKLINILPENIKVKYKGFLEKSNLQETIANYHLFFFPTYSENFGHVIAEAMLSSCPVLISDNTPWNWVNEKKCGYAIALNDKEAFVEALKKICLLPEESYLEMRKDCRQRTLEFLNIEELEKEYAEMLNEL